MLAGREVPDVVEAWAHHSGSGSGLPSPTRQPLLVHFPQMIQNVNEFSISQKAIEKKSFSGAVRINISENITFINISISKDYKIMRCGNKKTSE